MFCPECGSKNTSNAKFCVSCGYKINNQDSIKKDNDVNNPKNIISKKSILSIVILFGVIIFSIYYIQEQAKEAQKIQVYTKIDKVIYKMQTLESKWIRWHDIYNSNNSSCANAIYKYASNSEYKREIEKCVRKAKSIALSTTQYSREGLIEAKSKSFKALKELKNSEDSSYIKRKLNSINHNIDGSYSLKKNF